MREYTLPTVKFPDGSYIMDSKAIAGAIEKLYPQPSFRLDSDSLPKVVELAGKLTSCIMFVWMPKVPEKLLLPRSKEYFERTRAETFGKPLSELEKEKGGEAQWELAKPRYAVLGEMLRENGGPYFLGKTRELEHRGWNNYLRK